MFHTKDIEKHKGQNEKVHCNGDYSIDCQYSLMMGLRPNDSQLHSCTCTYAFLNQ